MRSKDGGGFVGVPAEWSLWPVGFLQEWQD